MGQAKGGHVTDILIRGLSDDAVARIEERASALGLSRNEYLRRHLNALTGVAVDHEVAVTVDDLKRATVAARDLDDPTVMSAAWR